MREVTDGRGVDVVLNSLAGEAIARGLECLRPGGRFVELGKRDVHGNQPMLLRPFRDNLSYFAVDITRLAADAPQAVAEAFAKVARRVTAAKYRPLPHQAHPATAVEEALRSLRHSRHLGKVVVTFDAAEPVRVEQPDEPLRLDPDATYFVTRRPQRPRGGHRAVPRPLRRRCAGTRRPPGRGLPRSAHLLDELDRPRDAGPGTRRRPSPTPGRSRRSSPRPTHRAGRYAASYTVPCTSTTRRWRR